MSWIRSKRHALIALFAAAVMGLAAAVAGAAPAQAATARNGVCESGEFCLYYNSDTSGSVSDFAGSVSDYGSGSGCYKFISAGAARSRGGLQHSAAFRITKRTCGASPRSRNR